MADEKDSLLDIDRSLEFTRRLFLDPETGAWNKRTLLTVGIAAAAVGLLPLMVGGALPVLGAGGALGAFWGGMLGLAAAGGMELFSPTTTRPDLQREPAPRPMGGLTEEEMQRGEDPSIEVPTTLHLKNAERRHQR